MSDFTTGVASFEVPNQNGEPVLSRITVFASGTVVLIQEDLEDISKINAVFLDKQAVEAVLYMLTATPAEYVPTPPVYPKLDVPVTPMYKRISQALKNIYKRLGVV